MLVGFIVVEACDCPLVNWPWLCAASSDNFWRYAAGTAVIILTELNDVLRFIKEPRDEILVPKTGVRIDNYKTTLPVRKGLSSSAAACVLVARAFSAVFGWNLSQRAEMELAYRGERLTSSQCGRMDQACAFGCRPVLLVSAVQLETLLDPKTVHAGLMSFKLFCVFHSFADL